MTPALTPFQSASVKDYSCGKVTVRLSQFKDSFPVLLNLDVNDEFILTFVPPRKGAKIPYRVVFVVNRQCQTAATNCWPRAFEAPLVGKPVYYEVTDAAILKGPTVEL